MRVERGEEIDNGFAYMITTVMLRKRKSYWIIALSIVWHFFPQGQSSSSTITS